VVLDETRGSQVLRILRIIAIVWISTTNKWEETTFKSHFHGFISFLFLATLLVNENV
jgi:hypothetical protein